jgi:hypothetical protein
MSCRIVFALLFVFATVSAFAGGELLTNPGFEDGDIGQFGTVTIPGWSTTRTDGFHHDESGNVIDAKAIKLSNNTVARQDFSVTAGQEYIFSAEVLSSSLDPLTQVLGVLSAKWYDGIPGDAGTAEIDEILVGSFDPDSDPVDTWKTVAGRLTAPPGAAYGRIVIKLTADPVSGYMYYDDVSVREVNLDADLNDDDVIDFGDYALLASDWEQSPSLYSIDGDGDVDIDDLLELIDNWLIEDPGVVGYQLVWADEFNGTSVDTTKWGYETGGGGWGNNELQYYTNGLNSSVAGGNLVIEAREEAYGGRNYTSARMVTNGKASWTYGRMEARIKLPYGKGMWPAFWMMPTAWQVSGWPHCGELDIMESVNYMDFVSGTIHFSNPTNGGHIYEGGDYSPPGVNFSDDFHIYSVEWEENKITWFVDGIQYHSDTTWTTTEGPYPAPFNKDFFFIKPQAPPEPQEPVPVPGRIEAEDYDTGGEGVAYHDTDATNEGGAYRGDGVDIEGCSDTGGGYNVGWIDTGEWMHYTIDVTAGTYDIITRVASQSNNNKFRIEIDDVDITGLLTVPNTGGWQNWTDVTKSSVTLTGGEHVLKFYTTTGGFNLNYIDIQ